MKKVAAISIVVCSVLGGLWMLRAQVASEHVAVPEDESGDADFSSCLVCHSDKNEGTTVHAVIEMGCDTCHSVDQDEDYTEIFLSTSGNDLCLTCHTDKEAGDEQLAVHAPVRRETCGTCHDPHSSEAGHLLVRPGEGTDAESNLCLRCHDNITAQLNKRLVHAAVEFGCATCHETHKSEPQDEPEGIYHLTAAQPELCLTCHDLDGEEARAAHSGQPVESAQCTTCHNPHGSDNEKLLNNFVHAAFEMGCDTCHAEPADGKVVLQEGAGKETCLMCHSDVAESLEQAEHVHFPLEFDDGCITCHNPHAATYEKQLKMGPIRTCLNCHSSLAEAKAQKDYLHPPVFEQSCTICHQPHGGSRKNFLRGEVNDVCLSCHNRRVPRAVQVRANAGLPFELFDGAVQVPAEFLQGVPVIPLEKDSVRGHPVIASHPVRGKYPLGEDMNCATCHDPHAGIGSKRRFVTDSANPKELCMKCH